MRMTLLLGFLRSLFIRREALVLENLALRQQLGTYKRFCKRPRLRMVCLSVGPKYRCYVRPKGCLQRRTKNVPSGASHPWLPPEPEPTSGQALLRDGKHFFGREPCGIECVG